MDFPFLVNWAFFDNGLCFCTSLFVLFVLTNFKFTLFILTTGNFTFILFAKSLIGCSLAFLIDLISSECDSSSVDCSTILISLFFLTR